MNSHFCRRRTLSAIVLLAVLLQLLSGAAPSPLLAAPAPDATVFAPTAASDQAAASARLANPSRLAPPSDIYGHSILTMRETVVGQSEPEFAPGDGASVSEWIVRAYKHSHRLLCTLTIKNFETKVECVSYNARNRPTQQQWVVPGAGGGTFRMDAAFDEADRKSSLTYPGGNAGQVGEMVSYGYNAVGQLVSVSGLGGVQYVSSASYNAQGQLTQLVNEQGNGANGLTRQWVYEGSTLRLSVMQAGTAAPFENVQKLSYGYDNVGNITSLSDGTNSDQAQSFGYDWLNRLTSASTNAVGVGQYDHAYSYDAVGNITSYAGNVYTYGDPAHKHAVTAAFGNSYGYDANGNQTSRTVGGATYTFAYDYENRLTSISGSGVSASFVYDADGQRVKGTVNGVTTVYIAGVYEWQNGATTLYYEGNAMRRSGYASDNGVFYLLQDHLKSSSAFVTQNGTVASRNYYFPFGGNRGGTAFSSLTTKRFTGQYHEASLPGGEGLSYYGARWYDAQLGRFLSADTIVPNPSNPQDLNRYAYVRNTPLQYRDPSGHEPIHSSNYPCSYQPCIKENGQWIRAPVWSQTIYQRYYGPYSQHGQKPPTLREVQTVLDVVGFVDPTGIADGANAAIHLARGRYREAAISAAATIPLGDLAKGGNLAAKLGLHEFTKRNYREAFIRFTGVTQEAVKHLEAHHVFPQKFEKWFFKYGIKNIHDPRLLVWVEEGSHRQWSFSYNQDWQFFLDNPTGLTSESVLAKAQELAKKYNFHVYFDTP